MTRSEGMARFKCAGGGADHAGRAAPDVFAAELLATIPAIRAYAWILTRDSEARDDLAQEAILKAWAKRDQFTLGTCMRSWAFMIVRNQYLGQKRTSWRTVELDQQAAETTLVANENPVSVLELDDLREALDQLPADQREALMLVAAAGLSYEEVARICGCPIGTVKSRVSRARASLLLIMDHGRVGSHRRGAGSAASRILATAERVRARQM
jgi:RNA polymerase sigma-70 factor (ECF subfamily)